MIKKILILIFIFSSISCSGKKTEKESAELAYTKAFKSLKEKTYSQAADEFEKIDSDFPFSKWAKKGQIMAIYARYKDQDHGKLTQIAEDFLRMNPNSEFISYVLYMKGLSHYKQMPSIERAQDSTQQASYTFRELIARFPTSEYSQDATEKIELIDEHLAGAKMSIGRFQAKNGNYIGAINNFKEVIRRYRQTNQIAEAYFRLGEIYTKIGFKKEARNAIRNLKNKFPESDWAKITDQKLGND